MSAHARALVLSVEDRDKVIKGAFEGREGSYSPYSKFRVGAALLSTDGQIIKGANIENASYGGTICAERTALVKAISEGVKSFVALAVVTDVASPISPCGMCRQVIREFCTLEMPVYLVPSDYPQPAPTEEAAKVPGVGIRGSGGVRETTLGELLPDSFGPEHLDLPRA